MRALLAVIVAIVMALPIRAAAEPASSSKIVLTDPKAKEHFKRAQSHFGVDNYAKAAVELKSAYALEPHPLLLYGWAQAERLSGNCNAALPLYERFLETGPTDKDKNLAEANVLSCKGETGTGTTPVPDDPTNPGGDELPADGTTDNGEGEIKPAYRDWLGATLVGVGAAGAIAGAVLMVVGKQEVDDAEMANSEDDYFDELASGRTKHTAGIVLLSVGAALIVGGVIRYAVLGAKNRKKRRAQTTLLVPRGGFGLGLHLRF